MELMHCFSRLRNDSVNVVCLKMQPDGDGDGGALKIGADERVPAKPFLMGTFNRGLVRAPTGVCLPGLLTRGT